MRDESLIRKQFELLDLALQESKDFEGDNFKYGYLMGKMIALEWALGGDCRADVANDYDYEDWRTEVKNTIDDPSKFKLPEKDENKED